MPADVILAAPMDSTAKPASLQRDGPLYAISLPPRTPMATNPTVILVVRLAIVVVRLSPRQTPDLATALMMSVHYLGDSSLNGSCISSSEKGNRKPAREVKRQPPSRTDGYPTRKTEFRGARVGAICGGSAAKTHA